MAAFSFFLQLRSNLTCGNSPNSVCRGVHGVLLELLSCKSNLHTAVEVTGGNQLFHVVVDNDTVATKIVEVLTRDKMGRATFLPLNRIKPSDVNYPDHGTDAVPMLKLLKFNSKFAPAMKQVSGLIMAGTKQHVLSAACGQLPSASGAACLCNLLGVQKLDQKLLQVCCDSILADCVAVMTMHLAGDLLSKHVV